MIKKSRLITLFLAVMLMLTFTACGSTGATKPQVKTAPETINSTTQTQKAKMLVVYFSRAGEQYGVGTIKEGNTAIVAKIIAEQTGADIFEIKPVDNHYNVGYKELTNIAKQEKNAKARPLYAQGVPDLSKYNTVFIGAPVWWGDWPMICYSFIEKEKLSGKTLYPFSTHGGSGLAGFDQKLKAMVPQSTVGEGIAITGTECQSNQAGVKEKVVKWLKLKLK